MLVDEGTSEETLVIRTNIKGNALSEDPQFRFTDITLSCYDVTTGE